MILLNTLVLQCAIHPGTVRFLSTLPPLFKQEGEPEYRIQDQLITLSKVKEMPAEDRTVIHWQLLVDWDLQRQRPFVVVDPLDPTGLLYLTLREYTSQQKVCMSNDYTLIVVCRPGSHKPQPVQTSDDSKSKDKSSKNSPLYGIPSYESAFQRASRLNWRRFADLKKQVLRVLPVKGSDRMISESADTVARTVLLWVRYLAHYAEVKNPNALVDQFIPLIAELKKLLKCNGQMAAVKHLKVSLFCLYSYVAGSPVKSTYELGWPIRLAHGLPACWDLRIRQYIRGGNINVIRVMASLLNIYRAMDAPHKEADITSIVKVAPDITSSPLYREFEVFCRDILPTLLARHIGGPIPEFRYQSGAGLVIHKAGANVSGPALGGISRDARAWLLRPVQERHVLDWFNLHSDTFLVSLIEQLAQEPIWSPDSQGEGGDKPAPRLTGSLFLGIGRDAFSSMETSKARDKFLASYLERHGVPYNEPSPHILGRLHALDEPAGKVRVVAICDYWTQVAMKPVHDWLFQILRGIKTDATFDQLGRVEAYFQMGLKPHWSFDLKAATDSIPLALYKAVLLPLMRRKGEDEDVVQRRVDLWAKMMVDREFLTPDKQDFVRYGTGQPMGALSSWASMALVHHALVQFSNWRGLGGTLLPEGGVSLMPIEWYPYYMVLGDDVDIAKRLAVAAGYQDNCASFYIKIGLEKTIKSLENSFEFANQRYSPDGNISPLSLKEELSSFTWEARHEYSKRILARFGTSLNDTGSALVRKAATPGMWQALQSQLSNPGKDLLYPLLKFCLLNPFRSEIGSEFKIDNILEWIAPIVPEMERLELFRRMDSTQVRADLSLSIARAIVAEIKHQLNIIKAKVPNAYSLFLPRQPSSVSSLIGISGQRFHSVTEALKASGLNELLNIPPRWRMLDNPRAKALEKILLEVADGRTLLNPWSDVQNEYKRTHAPYTVLYYLYCISKQYETVISDVAKWQKIVSSLERDLAVSKVADSWSKLQNSADRLQRLETRYECTLLSRVFNLWQEVVSSPQPIEIDILSTQNVWLKYQPETLFSKVVSKDTSRVDVERLSILKDRALHGPYHIVINELVKATGIFVQFIPEFWNNRVTGPLRREGTWMQIIANSMLAWVSTVHSVILGEQFYNCLHPQGHTCEYITALESSTTLVGESLTGYSELLVEEVSPGSSVKEGSLTS